ncbi:MAG: BMP family ABC transporter substrate-binding protein [Eubacteriales bacterium]|nr:BMP family ABC transporter substrate-binding protein [Eubacteriales bacterium]
MKKFLAVLLCFLMVASLTTVATAEGTDNAPALKVAVCISEALGDLGFNDSADQGLKDLEADYGVVGSIVECKSDASKYQSALVDAAEANDVVVAVGWQFWDALTAVVPEMPETLFIFVDNGLDGLGDNLLSIVYAENEGSFLAGYIAMKTSASQSIGFVGGEDSDTINNFFVGYKQGALYANPDGAVLDPVYAGDYDSPDVGKELATALYNNGADVVFAVAGKTGLGVFEAAKEQDKYAIGVDSDQKYIDPDHIICSMKKDIGGSVYDVVARYIVDGTFDGGTIWDADMTTGFVGIGYGDDTMTQQVSDELKAEVQTLSDKIIAGEIVVETTR